MSQRLLNAVLSYQGYIIKTFWPAGLAAHYPFPGRFALAAATGTAGVLLAITFWPSSAPLTALSADGLALVLGMLVPVIGLVQVGRQAMADRYTYLPQIGMLMMIVFPAADFLAARRWLRPTASAIVARLVAVLIVVSWRQTRFGKTTTLPSAGLGMQRSRLRNAEQHGRRAC